MTTIELEEKTPSYNERYEDNWRNFNTGYILTW